MLFFKKLNFIKIIQGTTMSEQWGKYWNNNWLTEVKDPQKKVGRTIHGKSISDSLWEKTIDEIKRAIEIDENDVVLDLCCGNGTLSLPLAKACKKVVAVDFSELLLDELRKKNKKNIDIVCQDVNKLEFPDNYFNKIICYFSLQYLNEKETAFLINNIFKWLKHGGICYIGDIPDIRRRWKFYNKKEYSDAYFKAILNNEHYIDNWFDEDFLIKCCGFIGFKDARIMMQPEFMFNSWYRYDLIAKKQVGVKSKL